MPPRATRPPAEKTVSVHDILRWDNLDARLIWAYEGPIRAPFRHCGYPGDVIRAWFLRSGSLTMHFPDGSQVFERGHWVFPKQMEGTQEFSPDADIVSVRFSVTLPEGGLLFEGMRERSISIPEQDSEALTRYGASLAGIVSRNHAAGTVWQYQPRQLEDHLECQHLFYGWLMEFCRLMKKSGLTMATGSRLDERILTALRWMNARPLESTLREGEVARIVGLSVSQFNRLFASNIGCTPMEYWDKGKIDRVRIALQETERSIKSIAYGFGFKSLSHFSVWTRKHLGVSPRSLRQKGA